MSRLHTTLGGTVRATLRPATLRRGELILAFPTEAAAVSCEQAFTFPGVFEFTDTEAPAAHMSFIPGTIRRTFEESLWLITVSYQEVTV